MSGNLPSLRDINKWRLPAAIAQRVEDALSQPADRLRQLGRELQDVAHSIFAAAPGDDLKREILGPRANGNSVQEAYLLGQLTFAQGLVDQLACRRETIDFQRLVADARFIRYVGALCLEDLNNAELAKRVGEADETVSRKLKELRSEGVVDFRREGRNTVNFLTPAARASFAEHCAASRNTLVMNPSVVQLIRDELNEKPSHFRMPMTFSSKQPVSPQIRQSSLPPAGVASNV